MPPGAVPAEPPSPGRGPAPTVRTARRDPLDPAEIRARVQACPDVARLVGRSGAVRTADPGREDAGTGDPAVGGVEVVSYANGRRVEGVRVRPGAVTVRVVCRFGPTVAELATQVRAAVLAGVPDPLRVDVIIDDLEVDAPAWAGVPAHAGQGTGDGR